MVSSLLLHKCTKLAVLVVSYWFGMFLLAWSGLYRTE